MFDFKTRKELKEKIRELTEENELLRARFESVPADCKPGAYCEACTFSSPYYKFDGPFGLSKVVYLCKKDDCHSFILRPERKVEVKEDVCIQN